MLQEPSWKLGKFESSQISQEKDLKFAFVRVKKPRIFLNLGLYFLPGIGINFERRHGVNTRWVVNTSCAFFIYRSGTKAGKERVFFNDEAKSVLLPPIPDGEKASLPEISSLCSKWKEIFDRRQDEIKGSAHGEI